MDESTEAFVQWQRSIPVENLWMMYLYASERLRQPKIVEKVECEDAPDQIPNLLAALLCHFVQLRLRKNLNLDYQVRQEALNRVRGRIDLLTTFRKGLLSKACVACRYDDLSVNSPRNAFIRCALDKCAQLVTSDSQLKKQCLLLARTMVQMGVTGPMPDLRQGGIRPQGQNDRDDTTVVALAELVMAFSLLTQKKGQEALPSIIRVDEHELRRLYELSVYGFLKYHMSGNWRVTHGNRFKWPVHQASDGLLDILPGMQTDILLDRKTDGKKIIIDTKFTSIFTSTPFTDRSLKTQYLYQMYAYLRTQEKTDPTYCDAVGVLLHPQMQEPVFEYADIESHRFYFATINLKQSSRRVKRDLLALIHTITND